MRKHINRGRKILAVLGVSAAMVGTSAVPSQAATGAVMLCSQGNYVSYVKVPQQGGITTIHIYPGQCLTIGINPGTTYVDVWGVYNNPPANRRFYVGTWGAGSNQNISLASRGTTTGAWITRIG